jgi:omega-6 fatty acid desaturase (delta-12 desaturase)
LMRFRSSARYSERIDPAFWNLISGNIDPDRSAYRRMKFEMTIPTGPNSEMNLADKVKAASRDIIKKYSTRSDAKAVMQCVNTLVPYFILFYLSIKSLEISYWLTAASILLLSMFMVRIFMLMHDCGHKSLFRTQVFNDIFGFLTGVIVGMPQYVWSQHHNYHHSTNGNWEKYRGPLNILSVAEYEKLSSGKQRLYRYSRNIFLAPAGAFMYFIFSPRFNWILGSLQFAFAVSALKLKNFQTPLKEIIAGHQSRFWKTGREYRHMTLNNVVLLSIWYAASTYFGTATFFNVYLASLSLAGAAGIIIFTIQHNFEDAYASDTNDWNYHLGLLKGTSFLTFPRIINWFGADIAYHHVHHLSASIPNYNLASCHKEYAHFFEGVTRIRLRDIAHSFKFILWNGEAQNIISVDQYHQMKASSALSS